MTMKNIVPFLKWPGGKRWIVPYLKEIIDPSLINNYFEPFLGGGAVFFSFDFTHAVLSDKNKNLINAYKIVKDYPDEIIDRLKKIQVDKNTYYRIRNEIYTSELENAVQFIYLNRLAFGGMYRVNRNGFFNVPFGGDGRSTELFWTKNLIINASEKLKSTKLNCFDFSEILKEATSGDLVYCDPPYTVCHNLNGFQRYNEKIFEWQDQIRLAKEIIEAANRGVKIIVSNAAHESVRKLYYPFEPKIVNRYSGLSRNISSRKTIDEFLYLFNL